MSKVIKLEDKLLFIRLCKIYLATQQTIFSFTIKNGLYQYIYIDSNTCSHA